ncbi:MAG: hypothetical protein JSV15_07015 [Candidatus Bathyarchaeota archaeon]|nr:MAG: hypothetical protein JSV15_07015 [Candidatus Bathyarchaeota archaeon]
MFALQGGTSWDVTIIIIAVFCIMAVVPAFYLFRKGEAHATTKFLYLKDGILGTSILLLSIFSVSRMYPGGAVIIIEIMAVMVVAIFIPFGEEEAHATPRSLDGKAVMLGVLILLLTIFSVNTLYVSVVPSIQYPGYYTHSDVWDIWGDPSLLLIFLLGWVAIFHGGYRFNFLEFTLGMSIAWWGFWTLYEVGLSAGYLSEPHIRGSVTVHLNRNTLYMMPNAVLGIALALNGLWKRKT